MGSSTSSFRISDELKQQLEAASRSLRKRKNWILTRALHEYLQKLNHSSLAGEARRQSLLASGRQTADARFWEKMSDRKDWK